MLDLAISVEHQLNPPILQLHGARNAAMLVFLCVNRRSPENRAVFIHTGGKRTARIPVIFRQLLSCKQNRSVLQRQQLVNPHIFPNYNLRFNHRDRLFMARQFAFIVLLQRIRMMIRSRRFLRRFHTPITVRACEHIARAGNARALGLPRARFVTDCQIYGIIRRLHAQLGTMHRKAQFRQLGAFHLFSRKTERFPNRFFGNLNSFLARNVVFVRQEVDILIIAAQLKFIFQFRISSLLFQTPFGVKLAQLLLHDAVQRNIPFSSGSRRIMTDEQRIQRRFPLLCAVRLQRGVPFGVILFQIILEQQFGHGFLLAERPVFHVTACQRKLPHLGEKAAERRNCQRRCRNQNEQRRRNQNRGRFAPHAF